MQEQVFFFFSTATWCCFARYIVQDKCGFEHIKNGTTISRHTRATVAPSLPLQSDAGQNWYCNGQDCHICSSHFWSIWTRPKNSVCSSKSSSWCAVYLLGLWTFIHLCGLYKWKNKAGPMHSWWANWGFCEWPCNLPDFFFISIVFISKWQAVAIGWRQELLISPKKIGTCWHELPENFHVLWLVVHWLKTWWPMMGAVSFLNFFFWCAPLLLFFLLMMHFVHVGFMWRCLVWWMYWQPTNCKHWRLRNALLKPVLLQAGERASHSRSIRSQAGRPITILQRDSSYPDIAAARPLPLPLGIVQSVYLYYMFSTGWPPSLSATRFLWTRTFQADWVLAGPHTHATQPCCSHTNAMWFSYCTRLHTRCPCVCLLLRWR